MPKIPGLSAVDDIVSEAIKNVYKGINESTEQFRKSFDIFGRFRHRHMERMSRALSSIQILGMAGPQKLTDIYVPSRLSPRIGRNHFISDQDISDLDAFRAQAAKTEVNIFDTLRDTKNLLIMGVAGSGKTTFISALTLGHLDECQYISNGLHERLFPICFTLREFGSPTNKLYDILKEYVLSIGETDSWPFVERLLEKGRILLILDGLDEIPVSAQEYWRITVKHFEAQFPKVRIVITCRSGSLAVDFSDFQHLEVLPFSRSETKTFVESWFQSNSERGQKLLAALKLNKRVNDLTSTPLLLSLLCNLFNNDLEISSNRTELYSRCIEVMITRWDTSRGFKRASAYQNLSITRRKRIFEEIAHKFSEEVLGVMSHEGLLKCVSEYIQRFDLEKADAEKVLGELETHHGILVRLSANYWSFSHISFQDYFCAEYVKDKKEEENYLRAWWTTPRRAEVLIFIGTLLEDASEYVASLLELSKVSGITTYPALARRLGGIALVTRLLAQGVSISPDVRESAITQIIDGVVYAVRQLGRTGINLYARLINGEPRLGYTFYKRRPTSNAVHGALSACVFELAHSNYGLLFEKIKLKIAALATGMKS